MTARLLCVHVFPVKACRGIRVDEAEVTPRGIRHDREFMVVTPDGAHLSQREIAALATIRPGHDGEVTVHRRPAPGVDQGDAAAKWLSEVLGVEAGWCGARTTAARR